MQPKYFKDIAKEKKRIFVSMGSVQETIKRELVNGTRDCCVDYEGL